MRFGYNIGLCLVLMGAGTLTGCNGDDVTIAVLTPEMAVAPSNIGFGSIGVLREDTQPVYISNAGKAVLEVSVALEDDAGVFTYLGEPSYSIAPDESVQLDVNFAPANFLEYSGQLVLTHNDSDVEGQTATTTVALTGEGVDLPVPDIDIALQTLDFGSDMVPNVDEEILTFRIDNVGDDVLVFTEEIVQEGAGTFEILDDVGGRTVPANDYRNISVKYKPIFDTGDTGTLRVRTNDPDEPEVIVQLLGYGGGDFEYPVAVVDCPDDVFLAGQFVFVDLDGTDSFDPAGYDPLLYLWQVDGAPDGSTVVLKDGLLPEALLEIDVAGAYDVSLQVFNQLGAPSVPARCTISAIPEDEIHVELTWNTEFADMDLHLWQDGFGLYSDPEDANWCNAAPDWGTSGTDDNPRLDIDDQSGFGPENINIRVPEDNTYHVGVHYFDDAGDASVVATVNVWSLSELVWSGSQVMVRNEVWEVGQLNWPDGTFAPSSEPLVSAGANRSCD